MKSIHSATRATRAPAILAILMLPLALSGQVLPDSAAGLRQPSFMLVNAGYTNNRANPRIANAFMRPALLSSLSFYSSKGLYAAADYYNYFSATQSTWEGEIGFGYTKTWKEQFDLDVSYGFRHFSGDSIFEGINYRHDVEFSGAWRPKNFTLSIDNSLLLGGRPNYFLDLSLSYDFSFDGLPSPTGSLVISPTVTSSFGTTYWIPGMAGRIWERKHGGMPPFPFQPKRDFEYQNLSLILPVQYSLGSFTLSVAGYHAIPSRTLREQQWTSQSGFLVTLNYALIFSK